jgi:hypothetical protein
MCPGFRPRAQPISCTGRQLHMRAARPAARMRAPEHVSGQPQPPPRQRLGRHVRQSAHVLARGGEVTSATAVSKSQGAALRTGGSHAGEAWKERKTYARCQACVKGALASTSQRGRGMTSRGTVARQGAPVVTRSWYSETDLCGGVGTVGRQRAAQAQVRHLRVRARVPNTSHACQTRARHDTRKTFCITTAATPWPPGALPQAGPPANSRHRAATPRRWTPLAGLLPPLQILMLRLRRGGPCGVTAGT